MIPIRNRKKTLQVTVEEMRNFALAYVEKYAPSKQQLKTYLLKKYMKLSSSDVRKKDVNKLIDIVLSDLEKNKFINDQFYSESKAKSMIQRGNSINKIRNYLIGKGINDEFTLQIFNRWGELIFDAIDFSNTWDGTFKGSPCQVGIYTYRISYKLKYSEERKVIVGHVSLIR